MKKLMFITLLFTVKSYAQNQPLPLVEGKIKYSEVVQLDSSIKKNDLYLNAKKFFVDVFNSGKDVIQMDDKESGTVIGRGYYEDVWKMTFSVKYNFQIWHTVKIYAKDGRYKFEIEDFNYKFFGRTSGWTTVEDWHEGTLLSFDKHNADKLMAEVDESEKTEIATLKKYMAKKQSVTDF